MARRRLRLGSAHSGWATTVWADPGGTTGWGVMSVEPSVLTLNKPLERNIAHWACGEIVGNLNQQASQVLELFESWDGAAIGIEKFHLRQIAVELSPVEITAKVEYAYWLMEKWAAEEDERDPGRPRHVFKQEPSLAKRTLTDQRMHDYKLWVPGKDHKRDAIKHCYTFLQRCQETPRLRAAAWPALFRVNGELVAKPPPTSKRSRY
jgi:hypothetical protein